MVAKPRKAGDYEDRSLDCEEALEPAFQELMALAIKVGWGEAEASAAIISLAENHMLSLTANDETMAAIMWANEQRRS